MKKLFEDYAITLTNEEDPVLQEIRRETNLKILMPRMLSGHFQGVLLEMISKMIKPQTILELGTFTAYSAICLAKGLKNNGKLHTVEYNEELEFYIKKNIKKSDLKDKINYYIGDALEIIPKLDMKFDLVFIDADKRSYLKYYNAVFEKVTSGGYIIVDNVFWNGKVLENIKKKDLYTKGVVELNNFIKTDNRIDKITLPVRDGLMILRKK